MIDSHIHIDSEVYESMDGGPAGVLDQAQAVGVSRVVAPSIHLDSYERLRKLQESHSNIYPAAGVHPHDATPERTKNLAQLLTDALETSAIPIVGETGLEGHYDFTPLNVQLESLRCHLDVAALHGLPVILHCRECEETLYRELKKANLKKAGVVHCFTGSWEWAQRFLELGYYIGITGIVTFKKSLQVQQVAALVPEDRLLVETDGPYLSPIPFRGKTNRPEYIPYIVKKIAELRNLSECEVATFTTSNTEEVFNLPKL
jgi:TatD DNase family protein